MDGVERPAVDSDHEIDAMTQRLSGKSSP
jgi:hypothetical protein